MLRLRKSNKLVIFVTGGHVTPAIACIEELLDRKSNKEEKYKIYYLGQKHSILFDKNLSGEYRAIEKMFKSNVKFLSYHPGKVCKEISISSLIWWLRIPIGFIEAFILFLRYKPSYVLSFGSHVALPIAFVGKIFGNRIVTHEQTVVIGKSNSLIHKISDAICLSWETTYNTLVLSYKSKNNRLYLTGNPVRSAIRNNLNFQESVYKLKTNKKPTIFITGGNQGAHAINEIIFKNIEELTLNFNLVHQTGGNTIYKDFSKANELHLKFLNSYKAYDYISNPKDWIEILDNADLVITRSGANTTTELLITKKYSIQVPLPNSKGNEQQLNAELLSSLGLALVIDQNSFISEDFKITDKIKEAFELSVIKNYNINEIDKIKMLHLEAHKKIVDILLSK